MPVRNRALSTGNGSSLRPTSSTCRRIFAFPPAAREGALVANGPDYVHMYRRAPFYVERILKGTKPAGLPVEQPTKLELIVNLNTAKALGLENADLSPCSRG